MDGFDAQLLARLPLARAVLELFDHVLDDGLCGAVFDAHRGRCYEDALTFATLVRVIRDALVLPLPDWLERGEDREPLPAGPGAP